MTDSPSPIDEDAFTLDPPGSVAVVGAGVLGVEAALYGRFLGYDVTLIEAEAVGSHLRRSPDAPLPLMPNECLSSLALGALEAQMGDLAPLVLPISQGQWVDQVLNPLSESDLMRGRLKIGWRVIRIDQVPIPASGDGVTIPPDFRLIVQTDQGESEWIDAEATILAIGSDPPIPLGFDPSAPYFFRIGQSQSGDWDHDLQGGRKEIVHLFASLAGRDDLDLYRPRRI